MKLLVTFLGTGNYSEATYRFGGFPPETTSFVVAAFARWFSPDRILVFVTREAEEKNADGLRAALGKDMENAEFVPIPSGADEAELWEIFGTLSDKVPEDSSLILDITHAFRSLPMLSLIALAYLRTTRNVAFEGLYYGAYEARDKETGEVPVFDLGEFVRLFDWLTAADAFRRTGNADRLSELLVEAQRSWWRDEGRRGGEGEAPRWLQSLGSSMKIAADNLLLLRTRQFEDGAESLRRQTENARTEIPRHAPPFAGLLEKACDDLTRCAGEDLATQRDLVSWLVERNQIAPAFTLAREWLLSLFIAHLLGSAGPIPTDYDPRKPYEVLLGHLAAAKTGKKPRSNAPSPAPDLLRKANSLDPAFLDRLLATWEKVRNVRNDLNHAGFSTDCRDARSIRNAASQLCQSIASLPILGE